MKTLRFATLSAAVLLGAVTANAQSVTPSPAPTIITSAPYTITKSGYYQLGADLSSTATSGAIITISANNVTLDFGGHFIAGATSNQMTGTLVGVSATDHNNITVLNGTISHCYQGIVFTTAGTNGTFNINQKVSNMLIIAPFRTGVYLVNTSAGQVFDSRIVSVGGSQVSDGLQNSGVEIDGGSGLEITGNTVKSSFIGVINTAGQATVLATRNRLYDVTYGLENVTKYQDNLTAGVTTAAFQGGTDAGGNN